MFLVHFSKLRNDPICDNYLDITNGTRENGGIRKYDLLFTPLDYFSMDGTIKGCICNVKLCVRQCCSQGEIRIKRKCVPSSQKVFIPEIQGYHVINVPENEICGEKKLKRKVSNYSLQSDILFDGFFKYSRNNFCLTVSPKNETFAIVCEDDEDNEINTNVKGNFCKAISCYFKI